MKTRTERCCLERARLQLLGYAFDRLSHNLRIFPQSVKSGLCLAAFLIHAIASPPEFLASRKTLDLLPFSPVPEPILTVDDLSIEFAGANRNAVSKIAFSIAEGETLGLVGESGSGKSAASLALLRLLPPSACLTGSIHLGGRDLLALSEEEMRRCRGRDVAMIFQEPMTALNPAMRVGEQIAEAIRAHQPAMARTSVQHRVIESMQQVGIPDVERRLRDYPHQFSGGQRQRILIAMAIVNRPRLLIADEPTTALDVTVQAQILALLRRLREEYNLAILFISHDLAVVSQIADRVAVMQHGRIVEQATADDIFFARPQHPYTRRLLAAAPTMTTERGKPLAAAV